MTPKISFLFLSFNLFLFFNLNLLRGTIKTDSVIVETTSLIDTNFKLMNSHKTLALYESDEARFLSSPKNSFLKKLYTKKTRANEIYKMKDYSPIGLSEFEKQDLTSFYFFNIDSNLIYTLLILSRFTKNSERNGQLVAFMKSSNFYEGNLKMFYYRTNIEKNKQQFINRKTEKSIENGLYFRMMNRINVMSLTIFEKKIKLFENVDEFINEFTCVSNVKFENYQRIFVFFYFFLVAILLVFVFHLICFKATARVQRSIINILNRLNSVIMN